MKKDLVLNKLEWLMCYQTEPYPRIVTMGAPLHKYGLEMLLFLIFLESRIGFSALQSWKSTGKSSVSAEHKATPKSSWLSSLCLALKGWKCVCSCGWSELSVESLFNDLHLEWSERGENRGDGNFILRGPLESLKRVLMWVFLWGFFRWSSLRFRLL